MESKTPDKVVDFKSFGDRPTRGGNAGLYIGNKNSAKALGILKEHGIKYILNCTPTRNVDPEAGCPNFFEKDQSLTYKRIPIFDNRGEDIIQYMEPAIAFIEQGKHYGSVLVHCNKGVSRSASFVIGYLMKVGGMNLTEALDMLKSKRSMVQPNDSFMTQLERYDEMLKKDREVKARQQKAMGGRAVSGGAAPSSSAPATGATQKRAAIGPALPPGAVKGPSPPPSTTTIGPSLPPQAPIGPSLPKPSIGPSIPPSASIGPSLPPPPPSTEPSNSPSPIKKKVIGPAMPPTSNGKRESEGGSSPPAPKRRNVEEGDNGGKEV